jgi:hypothetical protein
MLSWEAVTRFSSLLKASSREFSLASELMRDATPPLSSSTLLVTLAKLLSAASRAIGAREVRAAVVALRAAVPEEEDFRAVEKWWRERCEMKFADALASPEEP